MSVRCEEMRGMEGERRGGERGRERGGRDRRELKDLFLLFSSSHA